MDILTKISLALLDEQFVEKIKIETKQKQIYLLINKFIESKEEEKTTTNQQENFNKKIVGVSACATGVVHTYMAKEALEKAGEKLNYLVRIETQGQKGQEYTLTEQEINDADLVIIAADINIELDRFVGKKLVKMKTNDAIDNPTEAIEHSLKNATIYNDSNVSKQQTFGSKTNSKFGIFMQHMLSGVSRMIPFIVFSGII